MYKLFLCLKYLRRRYLAWVAALAVALCVFMVIVAVSVFDGFLSKVERAAKGLFGDIVIESTSLAGIAQYDEFIDYLGKTVPEVSRTDGRVDATPVIYSYGLLRLGSSYTETVQICGIRLPDRLRVTDFGNGLLVQPGKPTASFDPPIGEVVAAIKKQIAVISELLDRQDHLPADRQDPELRNRLMGARSSAYVTLSDVLYAQAQSELAAEEAKPAGQQDAARIARLKNLVEGRLDSSTPSYRFRSPADRMILGVGISGLTFRTSTGEIIRNVLPGREMVLTLLPIGRGVGTSLTPTVRTFTVIDDCKTDVYSVDSKTVYVPFETLQELAYMGPLIDVEDPARNEPGRCSQIQIKVRPELAGNERRLREVRSRIEKAWDDFLLKHPDRRGGTVLVQTWREKLDKYIGTIQSQRTLVTLMFGIISCVSVLLIFAIFYMIVMQKIRDLGVLRAVGGSSTGVAQIFLAFGAATGVVGSTVGVALGYVFVHYINEIHDWMGQTLGFTVWSRDTFLFDKIPNQVDPMVALVIVLWAMFAGLVGALIPSVRAAVMEPVEAIRYE